MLRQKYRDDKQLSSPRFLQLPDFVAWWDDTLFVQRENILLMFLFFFWFNTKLLSNN